MFGRKTRAMLEEIEYLLKKRYYEVDGISDRMIDLNIYLDKHQILLEEMLTKMEKFDENFHRFQTMFLEFKGQVSILRANLHLNKTSEIND